MTISACGPMDRSHARRNVMKLGYSFHKRRTPDSGSQLTLCVTSAEADEIASQRADQGFTASTAVAISELGVFPSTATSAGSAALYARFSSRGETEFADKLLSAMRFEFRGHVEKESG